MNVPSIHHVQVAMPSGGEDRARAFYRDLLGFREVAKPEPLKRKGGVWFETGNLQVHLGVDEAFVPVGKAHVAYLVADVVAVRSRIETAGFPVVDDGDLPGYERFYTSDPFGNRVEVLATAG